jgi:hypothetical protein
MSIAECTILYDIEKTLDDIESTIASFDSVGVDDKEYCRELNQLRSSSKLKYNIARTENLQTLVEDSGAFPVCIHPHKTDSVMTRWAVIIDDLYWSVFGCDNNSITDERNRMKIIHGKLQKIYLSLKEYIPSGC